MPNARRDRRLGIRWVESCGQLFFLDVVVREGPSLGLLLGGFLLAWLPAASTGAETARPRTMVAAASAVVRSMALVMTYRFPCGCERAEALMPFCGDDASKGSRGVLGNLLDREGDSSLVTANNVFD